MGLVYATIEIINAGYMAVASRGYIDESEIRKTTVKALVDSGAYMLAINEEISLQLGLHEVDKKIGNARRRFNYSFASGWSCGSAIFKS
ncbi:MAG: hypothetical protein ACKVOQ_13715 [Cyclobacteriaceae bacterium]